MKKQETIKEKRITSSDILLSVAKCIEVLDKKYAYASERVPIIETYTYKGKVWIISK